MLPPSLSLSSVCPWGLMEEVTLLGQMIPQILPVWAHLCSSLEQPVGSLETFEKPGQAQMM